MPGGMDERVVSMVFDNRKFEKNIKTSMKSLDDLKEALDFDGVSDSLEDVGSKFKQFGKENVFKNVDDSVLSLKKNMSILGNSAGGLVKQFAEITKITAMFQMAENALNRLKRSVRSFTLEPITQGFQKYETKIGSIKTIANATGLAAEKVDKSLDRLNWFTDETSASFESMVQNIGKFTSVGKGLDESITAMQGISTWGYHSGASVAEQNRAMYNLSQALGTGSVKLIDWKSIENAGMATKEFKEQAIAAAEAAGTLKRKGDKLFTKSGNQEVTVENFNSTLAKGWFSSDVLMDVLKTYGSFADELRRYQEAHPQYSTAAEAMEAMDEERVEKAAALYEDLSKLAEKADGEAKMTEKQLRSSVEKINKIVDPKARQKEIDKLAKQLGIDAKELTKIVDGLAKTEESLGEKAFKSSQQSKSLNDSIEATKDAVSTGWMKTFQYIFGGLDKSIELWTDVTDIMWDLFAAGADARNNAFMHWAEEFNGWADLWNADENNGPIGALRNIMDTIIELKDLLSSSFKNVFFADLGVAIGTAFGDSQNQQDIKNGLLTADQLRYRKEGSYMGRQLKNITQSIREFTATIRTFFSSNMDQFQRVFTAAAKVVKFFGSVISDVFGMFATFNSKTGFLQDIINLFADAAEKIGDFASRVERSGFVTKVFTKIGNTLGWFYNTLKRWGSEIIGFLEETGILQTVRDFFGNLETYYLGGKDDVDENGKRVESAFFRSFGWITRFKEWVNSINLKEVLTNIKSFFDNFGTIWGAFAAALNGEEVDIDALNANGLPKELNGIVTGVVGFGSKLSGAVGFIKDIFNKVVGWLESNGILPAIRSVWKTLTDFFGNLGFLWDYYIRGNKAINPADLTESQQSILARINQFVVGVKKAFAWVKGIFGEVVGWLENSGVLPAIRSVWKRVSDFFSNIGFLWNYYVKGNKAINPADLTETQQNLLSRVGQFLTKIKGVFGKVKGIFDKVVGWLESSGILPAIRNVWKRVTDFFGNIGFLWDYYVKGNKGINPADLTESQQNLLSRVEQFITKIKGIFEKIKGVFGKVVGWLESSGILPTIRNIWKRVTDFFSNIGFLWDYYIRGNKGINPADLTESQQNILARVNQFVTRVKNVFRKVKELFNGLVNWAEDSGILPTLRQWWAGITGLFGGEPSSEDVPGTESVSGGGGSPTAPSKSGTKKKSPFSKMFENIRTAFTDEDGSINLTKGFGVSIAKVFEMIGSIDWTSISTNVFGIVVDVINGLDDACGKMHVGNIVARLQQIVGAFTMLFVGKMASDISTVITTIITKGKKKGIFDKAVELLQSIGSALLQLGIAVLLIAGSIWLISTIKPENLAQANKTMIGIVVVFAGLIAVAKIFSRDKNLPGMLKSMGSAFMMMGIAIGIVAASIVLIAAAMAMPGISPERIIGATAIILVIIVAMGGVLLGLSKLNKGKQIHLAGSIAVFAGMAIVIAAVTVCVLLLQGVDFVTAAGNVLLLAGVILAMAGAMKIMNKVRVNTKTLILAGIMATFLIIITVALNTLKDSKPEVLFAISAIIPGLIFALAGAMFVIAKIPPAAIKGAAIFGAVLVILTTAIALCGLIVTATVDTMMNTLVKIMSNMAAASISAETINGEAIKSAFDLFDDIIAGFAKAVAINPALLRIALGVASDTWTFMNRLKLAGIAAEQVNVQAFKTIFGDGENPGILQTIQTGLSGITETGDTAKILGQNVESLGESLQLIGVSGQQLTEIAKDSEGNVLGGTYAEGIEAMKQRMADIQEIVTTATTLGGEATGEKIDLEKFADSVANIGAALQLYNIAVSQAVKDEAILSGQDVAPLNTENISEALRTVIASLTDVTLDEDKKAGVEGWAKLAQSDDGKSTKFALGLTNIANAMIAFSDSAKEFDDTESGKAISALQLLANIYTQVTNPSDYKSKMDQTGQWAVGDENTPGTFAHSIVKMGNAMCAFGNSVKNIPNDAVSNATTALDTMAKIYEKLGNGEMVTYFAKVGDLTLFGSETKNKTAEEVFTNFGEGISKLGDALRAFGESVSTTDKTYDSAKVQDAVNVLDALAKMQVALRDSTDKKMFYELDDNLDTLGTGLSGLGSKLTQFSKELKGFELDTTTKQWTEITTVLNYLIGKEIEIRNAAITAGHVNTEGNVGADIFASHYGLLAFAEGLGELFEQIKKINGYLKEKNEAADKSLYELGDWSTERMGNIFDLVDHMKGFVVDIKNANLSDDDIKLIGTFGTQVAEMFRQLNNTDLGNIFHGPDGVNPINELMNKINDKDQYDANAFATFIGNMKSIADIAGTLHTTGTTWDDVDNMAHLIEGIMGVTSTGFTAEAFDTSGMTLATSFISSFVNRLLQVESTEDAQTLSGAFKQLLEAIDGYSNDFYEKGKTAGSQFALGFNEGLGGIDTGSLSPVVSIDAEGNTANGQTGLAAILATMNYVTTADISTALTHIEAIKSKFDNPISVDDSHTDIVNAIGTANTKLGTINDKLRTLSTEVNNLKVYINSRILVGAIASDMDRELGRRANLSNVSP